MIFGLSTGRAALLANERRKRENKKTGLNKQTLFDLTRQKEAFQADVGSGAEAIKRGKERVRQMAEIDREFGDIAERTGEKGINVNFTETPIYETVSGGKKKKWRGKKVRNPDRKVQVGRTYGYDFERQGPAINLDDAQRLDSGSPRSANMSAAGISSIGMTGTSSESPINTMSGNYNNRQNLTGSANVGMTGTSSETPINQNLSKAAEDSMNLGESQSLADRARSITGGN